MNITLDKWQEDILSTKGNLCLRSGRQVGKSTIIAIKAGDYALNNVKKSIMIIAKVERQAQLIFEKILAHIFEINKKMICTKSKKPTKHKIMLKNGSVIHCLPAGESGYGIRGYTIDLLIGDEAAFIPEDVWTAVTPMLVMTGGDVWLLSTPFGREGYFYDCFKDETYTSFHISTEEILKQDTREEWQKDKLKAKLEHEKERMTRLQYEQEYLGEFVDDLRQFFSDKLIKSCMLLTRSKPLIIKSTAEYFLGVDIARMGSDESTFEILERTINKDLFHVESVVTIKTLTTMSTRMILKLDRQYNFKRIYVDDGGLGAGVFDQLLEDEQTRRKVVPVNNLRKALDRDERRKRKLLKEDLYNNLLRLMEQGKIRLLDDPEIFQSLKSVQYEYTGGIDKERKLEIFGSYTHIAEGLIRAAWCVKEKVIKNLLYSFRP